MNHENRRPITRRRLVSHKTSQTQTDQISPARTIQGAVRYPKAAEMTRSEYLSALRQLDLTPASRKTAKAIGLSVRQAIRIGNGECKVPEPVAIILRALLKDRTAT